MDKRKSQWTDIFSSTAKSGRALVQTYTLARAVAAIVAAITVLTVISYTIGITNIVFTTTNFFVPASTGDAALTEGPPTALCPNGTYTLDVVSSDATWCKPSVAGSGGFSLTDSTPTGVSLINNATTSSAQLRPLVGLGNAYVTANNSFITIYVPPSSLSYTVNESVATGQSLISSIGPDFTTLKKLVDSSSVFFSADTDGIQAAINFVVADALANGTSWIDSTDGLTLLLKQLFVSGALTLQDVGGGIYLSVDPALFGYTITSTPDGIPLFTSSSQNATQFYSLVNTPTVVFTASASNISASAILTLQDATTGGASLFSSYSGNTGVFKQLFSGTPGFYFSSTGTDITLNSNFTCVDGRPSILINGTAVCGWQYYFGGPSANCAVGTALLTWTGGSKSWCQEGPVPFTPVDPTLWPANTTLMYEATNYLGRYRAYTDTCPSAGQNRICGWDGAAIKCVCATRIDAGVATAGCPGGTYTLDSGIGVAGAVVCQSHVWDGAEVTVDTLVSSLSTACGGPTDVTSVFNCIWNDYIEPGLLNQTSAATIVYTPPFPIACQTSFTLAAMLNRLVVTQLPSNTFNVYINPNSGNDTCGGGTFANPWATIAYALTQIVANPVNRFINIVLSVNTHTVSGDLYMPPNVQFTTTGNLRYTTINVTGNIYLNTSWALYANDAVFTGFSGIRLLFNTMVLDFTTIGAYGPQSDVRFEFYNSEVSGNDIYVYGRGSVDIFHLNDIDIDSDMYINCATIHHEKVTAHSANTYITDNNCTNPVPQTFDYHFHVNNYLESSSVSVIQQTSTIELEHHYNGYDNGFLTLLATTMGGIDVEANGLPVNLYYNGNVIFTIRASTRGIAQANLTSSYWGATQLSAYEMFLVLQSYAKTPVTSGNGGIPLIYTSTITTNVFNELFSTLPSLLLTNAGNGSILLTPNLLLTEVGVGTSLISSGTASSHILKTLGNTTSLKWYANTTTVYADINFAVSTSGAGGVPLFSSTTGQTLVMKELFAVGATYLIDNATGIYIVTPSTGAGGGVASVSGTAGQISSTGGANPVLSFPSAVTMPGSLAITTLFYLSVSASVSAAGATQGTATALTSSINIVTTVAASTGVSLPTPSQGGVEITVVNNGANTLNVYPASGGTIESLAVNVPITLSAGARATYIASSTTQWWVIDPQVTGGTNINIVYTNGQPAISTTSTPTWTSETITAASNQQTYTFGGANTITMNVVAPTTSRTITWPDPGAAASILYDVLAQTISGLKTLGSDIGLAFANPGNTFFTTLKAASGLASSFTLRLPASLGNANDQLTGDGAGNLAFALPSVKTVFSNTATQTHPNPGAATFVTLFPTGTVSLTIPANVLIAGSKLHFKFYGSVSTSAASTFSFRVRLDGATTYGTSTSSTAVSLTTIPFECHGFLSVITAGAGGTALSSGFFFAFTPTRIAVAGMTSTTTVAIDTTTSHSMDVQFAFSASNAANTITIIGATLEIMKPYA